MTKTKVDYFEQLVSVYKLKKWADKEGFIYEGATTLHDVLTDNNQAETILKVRKGEVHKSNVLAYTPSGRWDKGQRLEYNFAELSGFIHHDIDGADNPGVVEFKEELFERFPYIASIGNSVRGQGLFILSRYEPKPGATPDESMAEYKATWNSITKDLEELSMTVDPSVASINEIRFMSLPNETLIRYNATPHTGRSYVDTSKPSHTLNPSTREVDVIDGLEYHYKEAVGFAVNSNKMGVPKEVTLAKLLKATFAKTSHLNGKPAFIANLIDRVYEKYKDQFNNYIELDLKPPKKATPPPPPPLPDEPRPEFPRHILPGILKKATASQLCTILARVSYEMSVAGFLVTTNGGFFQPQWPNVFFCVYGESSAGKSFNTDINKDIIAKYMDTLDRWKHELSETKKKAEREKVQANRPLCPAIDNATIEPVMTAMAKMPIIYTPGELPVLFVSSNYQSNARASFDATMSRIWDSSPVMVTRKERHDLIETPRIALVTAVVTHQIKELFKDTTNGFFYRLLFVPASIGGDGLSYTEMNDIRDAVTRYMDTKYTKLFTPPSRMNHPHQATWAKYDQYTQRLGLIFWQLARVFEGKEDNEQADSRAVAFTNWVVEHWPFFMQDINGVTALDNAGLLDIAENQTVVMNVKAVNDMIRKQFFPGGEKFRSDVRRKRDKLEQAGILKKVGPKLWVFG